MTHWISRSLFAMMLAVAMLAAASNPSRAALSTADRPLAAAAAVPAAEAATLAAVSAPAAPAVTAPVAAANAQLVEQPRKAVVHKAKPRRIASGPRIGRRCH